jgi:hypothetical protein
MGPEVDCAVIELETHTGGVAEQNLEGPLTRQLQHISGAIQVAVKVFTRSRLHFYPAIFAEAEYQSILTKLRDPELPSTWHGS